MMRYICGGFAALILLAGCGQMGPLVLPPETETPASKDAAPVTVQPLQGLPASGVQAKPAEPTKDKP
jgi:predicted small lipoprotein YifL